MKNELKVLVVAGLLAASGAFAQNATRATRESATPSKAESKLDANDIKKLEAEIATLQQQLSEVRKRGIDPAHHEEMMAQQRAAERNLAALQYSVENLDREVASVPRFQPKSSGPVTSPFEY